MNIELRGREKSDLLEFPFVVIKFLSKYLGRSSGSRNGPLRCYFHLVKLIEKQEG